MLTSGATWVTNPSLCRIGTCIEFNGNGGDARPPAFDITPNITIAGWIRADDFGISDARIISKATGIQEQDHYFMLSTVSTDGGQTFVPRFRLKTNGQTTTLIANSGGNLVTGVWTHVAAVYNGSNMILYKNGVEVGRTSKTGSVSTSGSVNVRIADNPSDDKPFDGKMDDLRIYNRGLSGGEIANLAGGGDGGPPPTPSPTPTPTPTPSS
ncbi:MAG: hypothetical protein COW88_01375, partial [Candidatus Lloydbacteria bacterium CG22_combo_CG10-13_8_21_14_all_47_15]